MIYNQLILITVLGILFLNPSYSQSYNIDENKYQKTIDLMFSFQMKEAIDELNNLQEKNASDPTFYFIKAIVYYYTSLIHKSGISDELFPTDIITDEFNNNINTSISLSKQLLKSQNANCDLTLLLGASYGFQGLFSLNQSEFISGYKKGKEGYEEINKILSSNKNYYDAYLGIGLYNLFTSYVPWYLRWLITSGEKKEGLKQINLVISNSKFKFTKYFALIYLDSFYYMEYRDNQSKSILNDRIKVLENFVSKYPDNFAMQIDLAGCYEIINKDQAIVVYANIIKYAQQERNDILHNYATYSLAELYQERREYNKAITCYQNILANSKKSTVYNEKSELKIAEIYIVNGEKQKAKQLLNELIAKALDKKIKEKAINLKEGL
ncbi:MAG: hypothetical protein COW71_09290 [Ignavibacteriales bacterium CG18_big_fil_WC_8_21_14_2_50_31_20]|nr:MAG: hypothetical protein COW71_09290 [Ignavibacteriales bacterium CG18_big_fil_WC_8_21_14_2_50_31_20]